MLLGQSTVFILLPVFRCGRRGWQRRRSRKQQLPGKWRKQRHGAGKKKRPEDKEHCSRSVLGPALSCTRVEGMPSVRVFEQRVQWEHQQTHREKTGVTLFPELSGVLLPLQCAVCSWWWLSPTFIPSSGQILTKDLNLYISKCLKSPSEASLRPGAWWLLHLLE